MHSTEQMYCTFGGCAIGTTPLSTFKYCYFTLPVSLQVLRSYQPPPTIPLQLHRYPSFPTASTHDVVFRGCHGQRGESVFLWLQHGNLEATLHFMIVLNGTADTSANIRSTGSLHRKSLRLDCIEKVRNLKSELQTSLGTGAHSTGMH